MRLVNKIIKEAMKLDSKGKLLTLPEDEKLHDAVLATEAYQRWVEVVDDKIRALGDWREAEPVYKNFIEETKYNITDELDEEFPHFPDEVKNFVYNFIDNEWQLIKDEMDGDWTGSEQENIDDEEYEEYEEEDDYGYDDNYDEDGNWIGDYNE